MEFVRTVCVVHSCNEAALDTSSFCRKHLGEDSCRCVVEGCSEPQEKWSRFCTRHTREAIQGSPQPVGANAKQVGGEHYKTPLQPWDFITRNNIGFLEGNAIKYICRHKTKGGKEDLKKAIHYLEKALEVYYP